MSTLMVLWCLYDENVCALTGWLVRHSMNNSKQSIMMAILFPNED